MINGWITCKWLILIEQNQKN